MPYLDSEPTVPQFLQHVTLRFGERRLISLGERRITYAEAGAESARLAHLSDVVREKGLAPRQA